jgi:hypothetical protein
VCARQWFNDGVPVLKGARRSMDQEQDRTGAGLGVADVATVERCRLYLHCVVDLRTVAERHVRERVESAVGGDQFFVIEIRRQVGGGWSCQSACWCGLSQLRNQSARSLCEQIIYGPVE